MGQKVLQGVGNVQIVGGRGKFATSPAYVTHFREYELEDSRRGRGEREIDEYRMNSNVTEDSIDIEWIVGDDAAVREIGFLIVGE